MSRSIVNLDELEYRDWSHGNRFQARMGAIGARLGARLLGCNVTVLPPGKAAFPLHNHHVNEELFLILEGQGEVRIGDATFAVRRGDVISCPPGGPETAHQILNTSDATELRFFAVSTRLSPEVAEYPESGKFAVLAELATAADGTPRTMRFVGRESDGLDYWDGE